MTATLELEGIHQAILDYPDDELHRLAYADWLEENGDEDGRLRAEFIRLQLKLDRPRATQAGGLILGRTVTRRQLEWSKDERVREKEILSDADRLIRWIDNLPGVSLMNDVVFRGGFVGEVHAPLQVLLDHGPEIVTLHPLTRMKATDRTPWQGHYSSKDAEAGFGPDLFGWWRSGTAAAITDATYDVPFFLLRILKEDPRCHARTSEFHEYHAMGRVLFLSYQHANDALSDALLTHCRKEAGK